MRGSLSKGDDSVQRLRDEIAKLSFLEIGRQLNGSVTHATSYAASIFIRQRNASSDRSCANGEGYFGMASGALTISCAPSHSYQCLMKVDVARRRYLNDDEDRLLVNATDPEFRPMVKTALLTGARYGELRHSKVKDFDPQSETLWFSETKSNEPRPSYLDKEGWRCSSRSRRAAIQITACSYATMAGRGSRASSSAA